MLRNKKVMKSAKIFAIDFIHGINQFFKFKSIITKNFSDMSKIFLLNKGASVFERGSLRLKGNEALRAGMRLRVKHSSRLTVTYYVPSVSQEYIPGAGFFTTAQVERGNGFILSAGIDQAPDLARRDLGGVK